MKNKFSSNEDKTESSYNLNMSEYLNLLESLLSTLGVHIGVERGIAGAGQEEQEKKTFPGIRFLRKGAIFIETGEAIW